MPPPNFLREYNEIIPDGADRLLSMVENESNHRRLMDRRSQTYPLIDQLAARLAALFFAGGALGALVYCASIGERGVAGTIAGVLIEAGENAFLQMKSGTASPAPAPKQAADHPKKKR